MMDVIKPPIDPRVRRLRQAAWATAAAVFAGAAVYALTGLSAAVPSFDRSGLWIDTVKKGPLVRQLRGVGELVTDDDASMWLAAELDARVDRKLLEEGAMVRPETVILQLSNRDVEQAAVAADLALQSAEAALTSLEAALNNELLAQRSAVAAIESDHAQASMQAEVDAGLVSKGLLAEVVSRQSTVRSQSLGTRLTLERNRLQTTEQSVNARLAVQRAEVDSRRTLASLRHRDLESLTVKAGMSGTLQSVVVQVGQRVARSANLARVVDPSRLKAQLRIPEAQTADLHTGLAVSIDTHNGIVQGALSRIAPAAQNGTVTLDVRLNGPLPPAARPDMTVDGLIELERLDDVLHVARPAASQVQDLTTLYRVSADGGRAERVTVRLGRASANEVEIAGGELRPGDRVVLSDTSAWGEHAVVRLRE
jgi:HlyD family secretion protein